MKYWRVEVVKESWDVAILDPSISPLRYETLHGTPYRQATSDSAIPEDVTLRSID